MTVTTGVPCPLCGADLYFILGRKDRGVCDYLGCHLKRDAEGRSCVWDLTTSPPTRIPGSHANRPDGDLLTSHDGWRSKPALDLALELCAELEAEEKQSSSEGRSGQ